MNILMLKNTKNTEEITMRQSIENLYINFAVLIHSAHGITKLKEIFRRYKTTNLHRIFHEVEEVEEEKKEEEMVVVSWNWIENIRFDDFDSKRKVKVRKMEPHSMLKESNPV